MSQFLMFTKLTEAFIERAEAMGKKEAAQAFIAKMQKECKGWPEYERALVFAWADGILYGNWPWVDFSLAAIIKRSP